VSTGFKILVALHLLCVIGGFGAVAYNALYVSLAQRRPGGGSAAVLEVNMLVSGLAELLIYSALVFGIGAVTASDSLISFGDAWVSASFGLYLVDVGILHGWIKRHQRHYSALTNRIEAMVAGAPPGTAVTPPARDIAELRSLERRISLGWAVFNVFVVVVVFLMVFKPGR
jgi:uncharacterized membrane protein